MANAKKPVDIGGFRLPAKKKAANVAPVEQGSSLRRSEVGDRVAVYLPPELAKQLRVYCAEHRASLSDVVTRALVSLFAKGT